jgi:hypothetical protein
MHCFLELYLNKVVLNEFRNHICIQTFRDGAKNIGQGVPNVRHIN